MSLDCQISDDGETECFDEGEDIPTSAENIYCWVPPTPGTTTTPGGDPTTTPSEEDPTTTEEDTTTAAP